jgi:hypothetical protein
MAATGHTRQWGIAWVALAVAIALHVTDEASTGFLPLYNSSVESIRAVVPWLPLPTFSFPVWLGGLCAGIVLLLALSPLVFAGRRIFRPISYFLGVLMIMNSLGHIGASVYTSSLAPGTISSPVLLLASIALIVTTRRVGRDAEGNNIDGVNA